MHYIAKSGLKFILFFGVLFLLALIFDFCEVFFGIIFVLSVLFFRNKISKMILNDPSAIISPIDGKISQIEQGELNGKNFLKITIKKCLFGVGVVFSPCESKILSFSKRHGLFLCDFIKNAQALNEKAIYHFENGVAMRVIAGGLSRELSLENPGFSYKGDELGFLGSGEVVLFLPPQSKITLNVGEKVSSLSTLCYL
ncbi:MAG: phosphatidylserine decarboxylase [Campylobacter sp.]|nr:phosphatidylserine decarboxylase [Campylobacter sp.]